MNINEFIDNFYPLVYPHSRITSPWNFVCELKEYVLTKIKDLPQDDYFIKENTAIHKKAIIEDFAVIKNYIVIEEGATVKSGAYLRDGVYIGKNVNIGANCEIKQSVILDFSRIAHLNYIGNSIVGKDVNIEAGAVLANHFNERENKEIEVCYRGQRIKTGVIKFGSLVGDGSRIGANAVLNPGTLLLPNSIVGRLVHINQIQ